MTSMGEETDCPTWYPNTTPNPICLGTKVPSAWLSGLASIPGGRQLASMQRDPDRKAKGAWFHLQPWKLSSPPQGPPRVWGGHGWRGFWA